MIAPDLVTDHLHVHLLVCLPPSAWTLAPWEQEFLSD